MAKSNNAKNTVTPASIIGKANAEAGEIVQAAHDKADEIIKDSTDAANKTKEDAEAEALEKIAAGDKVAEETIANAKKQVSDVPGKEVEDDDDGVADGCVPAKRWYYNGGVETGQIFEKGALLPEGWTERPTE